MKWWDWMPWFSFFECWVLSQLFHFPLSLSSSGVIQWLSFCVWFVSQNIIKVHPCCSMCQNYLPFKGWLIFCCNDRPHFVNPFIYWWISGLFPPFHYYKSCCYEHGWTSICLSPYFQLRPYHLPFTESHINGSIQDVVCRILFYFLNIYLFLNWMIIALQNCVCVCCLISTWISHRYTHVPFL